MKHLFELLSKHGGKIVSSNDLHSSLIEQARASNRMFVDENSLGYVWEPPFAGRFPETIEELEMYEWCYPIDVELPEELLNQNSLEQTEVGGQFLKTSHAKENQKSDEQLLLKHDVKASAFEKLKIAKKALNDIYNFDRDMEFEYGDPGERAMRALEAIDRIDGF